MPIVPLDHRIGDAIAMVKALQVGHPLCPWVADVDSHVKQEWMQEADSIPSEPAGHADGLAAVNARPGGVGHGVDSQTVDRQTKFLQPAK